MVARSRTQDQLSAARRAVEETDASPQEKAEMLMEIAMGMQQKPQHPSDLDAAVGLYRQALDVCPANHALLLARIRARMATALIAVPSSDGAELTEARGVLETALETLGQDGTDEELAEAEMNLGLVLQHLAGLNQAAIGDAIAAYQRALRTFDKVKHPQEFAILQNNLATAFLSVPFTDATGKMREALAVQAFEEGLKVVNLVDHPSEYAMLQNNLGNALQYASTSHRVENGLRALAAYDEALKVRNRRDTPGEYANTLANKANCLANLPDDPARPEVGNRRRLEEAVALYREARDILAALGDTQKVTMIAEASADIEAELAAEGSPQPRRANGGD